MAGGVADGRIGQRGRKSLTGYILLRDPIYDYIRIPRDIVKVIVDTPQFQRLRHIRQTGLDSLFPSAVHTRFTHSLGVYHLGVTASESFCENYRGLTGRKVPREVVTTFHLACLLHDIGHAPFSHAFEDHYAHRLKNPLGLRDALRDLVGSEEASFAADSEVTIPATHELMSAIVALERFKDVIEPMGGVPVLLARMITGWVYRGRSRKSDLRNCFIHLLNSRAIDVDKLDYIVRDSHSAGLGVPTLDVRRLLGALAWNSAQPARPVLRKSALSAVRTIVEARNFMYLWLHSHHKVVYSSYLLAKAVEALDPFIERLYGFKHFHDRVLFNPSTLLKPTSVGSLRFYLPTDHDVVFLLNCFRGRIPEARDWFERRHMKPLWKSFGEFARLFGIGQSKVADFVKQIQDVTQIEKGAKTGHRVLTDFAREKSLPMGSLKILGCPLGVKGIDQFDEEDILIDFGDGEPPVAYRALLGTNDSYQTPKSFFYVYASESAFPHRKEIIRRVREFMES